jgi:hypothetical protein
MFNAIREIFDDLLSLAYLSFRAVYSSIFNFKISFAYFLIFFYTLINLSEKNKLIFNKKSKKGIYAPSISRYDY